MKRASLTATDAFMSNGQRAADITSIAMDKLQNGKGYRSKLWCVDDAHPSISSTRYGGPLSRAAECRYDTAAQHIRPSTKALSH